MMIRMVRVFRLLRLVTRLKPLEVIVDAFVSGMKDVAWILVLCMLILFISGIIVTNWFLGNSALPPDTQERYFRSVGMSMVTLLRVMTMDWWDVITDTGDHVPVSYAFFFAFLVLAGFGIMGLFAAGDCQAWAARDHCSNGVQRFSLGLGACPVLCCTWQCMMHPLHDACMLQCSWSRC